MKNESTLIYPWAQRWVQYRLRTFFRVSRKDIEGHFSCTPKTALAYMRAYQAGLALQEGPLALDRSDLGWKEGGLWVALPRDLAGRWSYGMVPEEMGAWLRDGMIRRGKQEVWTWLNQLRGHELLASADHGAESLTPGCAAGGLSHVLAVRRKSDSGEEATRVFTNVETLLPALDGLSVAMVLQALFLRCPVLIEYRTKGGKSSTRWISPHHLVFADHRYHVRAFDHGTDDGQDQRFYMDFNLGRISVLEVGLPHQYKGAHDDAEWWEPVTLVFRVNPDLPDELLETVLETYMLTVDDDIPVVTTRAMEIYALREWQGKVFAPTSRWKSWFPYFVQDLPIP